ncbi:hypothetical protein J0667_09705 [Methylomonas sp. WH-1]|uniref:hypothetical protein n=1 Tax=unclassified Methylomonas TaxID=2608980 RepID=UPI0015833357|nr:hypothetical protein [Methylomonas sp. LW13]
MKRKRKLPPYGTILAERQKFLNLPFLAVVCMGQDAWNSAKRWNARGENCAMVLPPDINPEQVIWPVNGCSCVIEWSSGPDSKRVVALARCLLTAEAELVVVWPRFVDPNSPAFSYDATRPLGERWVQCREMTRVYHRQTGGNHVAA